jgi:8-oxo-dGTP diphosphatase
MEHIKPPEQLWHKGPNYTSDAIIIDEHDRICLIKRKSDGSWALPGGFRETDEGALAAAQREAFEEAGCVLGQGYIVYSGRVEDPRNNDNRWIESDAFLFKATGETLTAGDDATDAMWCALNQLPELYGSHLDMILSALDVLSQYGLATTEVLA